MAHTEQSDLECATQQGLVPSAQAAALVTWTQVAFYAGSLLIIGALAWFMSVVWESSANLFFLALAYVAVFGAAGVKLWFDGQAAYGIPQVVGGLFVTIAVSVAPIATYAAQTYLDEWPINRGILIELTLVAGGAVALYAIRFPSLTAPIALGLFGMATFDLAPPLAWTQTSAIDLGLLSSVLINNDSAYPCQMEAFNEPKEAQFVQAHCMPLPMQHVPMQHYCFVVPVC